MDSTVVAVVVTLLKTGDWRAKRGRKVAKKTRSSFHKAARGNGGRGHSPEGQASLQLHRMAKLHASAERGGSVRVFRAFRGESII